MSKNYRLERNARPPRWPLRFLEWFCPPDLLEGILGDLLEAFESDTTTIGERRARWNFILNTCRFFRPAIIFRNKLSANAASLAMVASHFRLSSRYFLKNKTFAVINIVGLAAGMAAAMLIYHYATYERSYDRFHTNADNIYRVTTEWNNQQTSDDRRATTVAWSGPGAKDAFPEVLEYTRFTPIAIFTGENVVLHRDTRFQERGIYLADPGFFRIFSFGMVRGDSSSALNTPTSIVITEHIARKYFGDEDPIGKELFIDMHGNLSENNFRVTGVVQDPPENSHLKFDFLISFTAMHDSFQSGSIYWHWGLYLRVSFIDTWR